MMRPLGAQLTSAPQAGTHFSVWAPNARYVSVVGDFNGWEPSANPMDSDAAGSGTWRCFIPDVGKASLYKFHIEGNNGYTVQKTDPWGLRFEEPPATASVVWDLDFKWSDDRWLAERKKSKPIDKPLAIYEVHLGSWRRKDDGQPLTYREMADQLPTYCKQLGFTHIELMPVMEHPFYGSWGYQLTGYFAPSSRYGTPQDFMFLINAFHNAGIGVILDWVPSHFPTDEHGLGYFDGTHLYEHADPKKGFHPDWKSFIFNLGRYEVRDFLLYNALFWLEVYHIDGLRVDGVASMLYLDYSRPDGEWIPNEFGGRENLETVAFLQQFNQLVHERYPDVLTIAEESTAWPGVTKAVQNCGLGFDLKWMMGWMHDTLNYFSKDPIYRGYEQGSITFSLVYAFSEQFMLPLSHDEVVHGKSSLLRKMPGDEWQQFANLRVLHAYMYGHPGAKLLFMGGEFGQSHEWRHDFSLDWHELDHPYRRALQVLVTDLNQLYRSKNALYELNYSQQGFEWIDINDSTNCVLCWLRKGRDRRNDLLFIAHFTPVVRDNYRVGVPKPGFYKEIFNSDNLRYGGSDVMNRRELEAFPIPKHGRSHSVALTLPPLAVVVLEFAHPDTVLELVYPSISTSTHE